MEQVHREDILTPADDLHLQSIGFELAQKKVTFFVGELDASQFDLYTLPWNVSECIGTFAETIGRDDLLVAEVNEVDAIARR